MSSHQSNKDKPRASKCHHFCHAFDTHNFCPTCKEADKGDDPCVTFLSPCDICASFSEEQLTKITHRKRYVKKSDKKADKNEEELDLLGYNSRAPKQTSRVLLTIYLLPRLALNLLPSRLYL